MRNNIFDLDNTTDFPEEVEIKRHYNDGRKHQKIYRLFELKDDLNKDEIMVGMYRKYKVILDRKKLSNHMGYLVRRGFLVHVGSAKWRKIK